MHSPELGPGADRKTTVTHDIRQRRVRDATPEEKERHRAIRQEIQEDLPQLKRWAKDAAARHRERVALESVLDEEER